MHFSGFSSNQVSPHGRNPRRRQRGFSNTTPAVASQSNAAVELCCKTRYSLRIQRSQCAGTKWCVSWSAQCHFSNQTHPNCSDTLGALAVGNPGTALLNTHANHTYLCTATLDHEGHNNNNLWVEGAAGASPHVIKVTVL
jgi:hypothetical protein